MWVNVNEMYIDYAKIDNDYDKRTMLVYYINVSLAMLNEFFWHVKNLSNYGVM